jgi:hypothetical protein
MGESGGKYPDTKRMRRGALLIGRVLLQSNRPFHHIMFALEYPQIFLLRFDRKVCHGL